MAKDNKQIATDVLAAVGGPENVANVLHCMTRLRFTLKDESIVNDDEVKAVNGALGVAKQGGQYQVIIGTNVPEVYNHIVAAGVGAGGSVDEKLDDVPEKFEWTPKNVGNAILNYISGSVAPMIPVMITGALFRTLAAIFGPTMLNLIPADSEFMFLCNMMANAAFYFMPILIGASAAKKLGLNSFLGAFMGCAFLEPSFVALASTEGASFSVYGISAPIMSYGSSLLPILLSIAVMAPLYRLVDKYMPASVRTVFTPFVTMLLMLPIAFCVLGPLGTYMGSGVAAFIAWLSGTPFGWLATTIVAGTWGLLVLTGMHLGLAAIALAEYAQTGVDTCILLGANIQAWACTGALLAVCLRMKDRKKKAEFWSFTFTQFFGGVGEPALFGIQIPYGEPFLFGMIGSAAAGLYASIMGVVLYTPIQGFAVPLSYIGGSNPMNEVHGVIGMVIGVIVSFVLTWFWGLTPEEREGADPIA